MCRAECLGGLQTVHVVGDISLLFLVVVEVETRIEVIGSNLCAPQPLCWDKTVCYVKIVSS